MASTNPTFQRTAFRHPYSQDPQDQNPPSVTIDISNPPLDTAFDQFLKDLGGLLGYSHSSAWPNGNRIDYVAEFANEGFAMAALLQLHGRVYPGSTRPPLHCKFATPAVANGTAPYDIDPYDSTPYEPAPSKPARLESAPYEPTLCDPAPSQSAPCNPTPTEPTRQELEEYNSSIDELDWSDSWPQSRQNSPPTAVNAWAPATQGAMTRAQSPPPQQSQLTVVEDITDSPYAPKSQRLKIAFRSDRNTSKELRGLLLQSDYVAHVMIKSFRLPKYSYAYVEAKDVNDLPMMLEDYDQRELQSSPKPLQAEIVPGQFVDRQIPETSRPSTCLYATFKPNSPSVQHDVKKLFEDKDGVVRIQFGRPWNHLPDSFGFCYVICDSIDTAASYLREFNGFYLDITPRPVLINYSHRDFSDVDTPSNPAPYVSTYCKAGALSDNDSVSSKSSWNKPARSTDSLSPKHSPRNVDQSKEQNNTTLFIGNIAHNATEDDMHAVFWGVVGVKDVRFLPAEGRKRKYPLCFVDFHDSLSAANAIRELWGRKVRGRGLHPEFKSGPACIPDGSILNMLPLSGPDGIRLPTEPTDEQRALRGRAVIFTRFHQRLTEMMAWVFFHTAEGFDFLQLRNESLRRWVLVVFKDHKSALGAIRRLQNTPGTITHFTLHAAFASAEEIAGFNGIPQIKDDPSKDPNSSYYSKNPFPLWADSSRYKPVSRPSRFSPEDLSDDEIWPSVEDRFSDYHSDSSDDGKENANTAPRDNSHRPGDASNIQAGDGQHAPKGRDWNSLEEANNGAQVPAKKVTAQEEVVDDTGNQESAQDSSSDGFGPQEHCTGAQDDDADEVLTQIHVMDDNGLSSIVPPVAAPVSDDHTKKLLALFSNKSAENKDSDAEVLSNNGASDATEQQPTSPTTTTAEDLYSLLPFYNEPDMSSAPARREEVAEWKAWLAAGQVKKPAAKPNPPKALTVGLCLFDLPREIRDEIYSNVIETSFAVMSEPRFFRQYTNKHFPASASNATDAIGITPATFPCCEADLEPRNDRPDFGRRVGLPKYVFGRGINCANVQFQRSHSCKGIINRPMNASMLFVSKQAWLEFQQMNQSRMILVYANRKIMIKNLCIPMTDRAEKEDARRVQAVEMGTAQGKDLVFGNTLERRRTVRNLCIEMAEFREPKDKDKRTQLFQYYENWRKAFAGVVKYLPALQHVALSLHAPAAKDTKTSELHLQAAWVQPALEFSKAQLKTASVTLIQEYHVDGATLDTAAAFAEVVRRKVLGATDAEALVAIAERKKGPLVSRMPWLTQHNAWKILESVNGFPEVGLPEPTGDEYNF